MAWASRIHAWTRRPDRQRAWSAYERVLNAMDGSSTLCNKLADRTGTLRTAAMLDLMFERGRSSNSR